MNLYCQLLKKEHVLIIQIFILIVKNKIIQHISEWVFLLYCQDLFLAENVNVLIKHNGFFQIDEITAYPTVSCVLLQLN